MTKDNNKIATKTLLLDIETAPKLAHVWGLWDQNVSLKQLVQDTYVLNWSAKWLGDDFIYSDALHYHSLFKKEPTNDIHVVESVWHMMDEADVIIGHNGDRFDIPVLNSRFLLQDIIPPSPYRSIDTLKIARRRFKLTSNKLEFLARSLGLGGKLETGGFDLWSNIVLKQDLKSFDLMVKYCEQDVLLLEEVYNKLKPWDNQHPIAAHRVDPDQLACNVCDGEVRLNGSYATNTHKYKKYKCKECGHNMRAVSPEPKNKENNKNRLKSL